MPAGYCVTYAIMTYIEHVTQICNVNGYANSRQDNVGLSFFGSRYPKVLDLENEYESLKKEIDSLTATTECFWRCVRGNLCPNWIHPDLCRDKHDLQNLLHVLVVSFLLTWQLIFQS